MLPVNATITWLRVLWFGVVFGAICLYSLRNMISFDVVGELQSRLQKIRQLSLDIPGSASSRTSLNIINKTILVPLTLFGPNNQIWVIRETFCGLLNPETVGNIALIMPPLFPHFSMKQFMGNQSELDPLPGILDSKEWILRQDAPTKVLSPEQGRQWWTHRRDKGKPLKILYIGSHHHQKSFYSERLLKWLTLEYGWGIQELSASSVQSVHELSCQAFSTRSKSMLDYDVVFQACFNFWINYKAKGNSKVRCPNFDIASKLTHLNSDLLLKSTSSCLWSKNEECPHTLLRNPSSRHQTGNSSIATGGSNVTMASPKNDSTLLHSLLQKTVAVQIRIMDNHIEAKDKIYMGSGKKGFPQRVISQSELVDLLHSLPNDYGVEHLFMATDLPFHRQISVKEELIDRFNISVLDMEDPGLNPMKRMITEEAFCVRAKVFIGLRGSTFTENIFMWRQQFKQQAYLF